ncbi:MAG: diguanylate cyclase domain-containing protein, partial [Oscillospiraceae bacterium]
RIKNEIVASLKANFPRPVVVVEDDTTDFDCVMYNNDTCTDLLIEHLWVNHCVTRVVYVSGPKQSDFHNRILNSFRKALDKYGVQLDEKDIYYCKDWVEDYSPVAKSIVENGLPSAVVCCSDFTAAEVTSELSRLGVKVPADTIVTGYSKNEPFVNDYINFTTVSRSPKPMAVNAARKIISAVKGTEFVPDDSPEGRLELGVTCGCAEIDYGALTRSAVDSMIHSRRDGFDSYYNFMSEELVGAKDFEDYLWKLNWYTFYLGDYDGFWMCLNDNVMHSEIGPRDYTDTIAIPYQNHHGSGSVDFKRSFDKKQMLPFIFEKRAKPASFIFTPLHFSGINFGYTVLSYGDTGRVYDQTFVKWLRYVTCAIEKQRRHIIYEDAVLNGQIRDQLTGLMNMRGFKSVMSDRFAKGGSKRFLRIISLDVGDLSGINTAYGYSEGDKLLQKLSVIMNNSCSAEDICVRVSGDEFMIAGLLDSEDAVDDIPITLQRNIDAFNSSAENEYGIHVHSARVTAPFDSLEVLDTLPYDASYQRSLTKGNAKKAITRSRSHVDEEFDPAERAYVVRLLNDNL